MSNGSLFSSCMPHANDPLGSSLCNSPRYGLAKPESTEQVSPTRLLVVKNSTTCQMLTQSIQVHVGTVVYTPFGENPLSTLCNVSYSPITDSYNCDSTYGTIVALDKQFYFFFKIIPSILTREVYIPIRLRKCFIHDTIIHISQLCPRLSHISTNLKTEQHQLRLLYGLVNKSWLNCYLSWHEQI